MPHPSPRELTHPRGWGICGLMESASSWQLAVAHKPLHRGTTKTHHEVTHILKKKKRKGEKMD